MKPNYIYLLKLREFIKTNENIYKIGMTKKDNLTRFNQYPNGSMLLFQMICNDCNSLERNIIKLFVDDTNIIHRKDIGNEYFEGDYNYMISIIYKSINEQYIEFKNNLENIVNNPLETVVNSKNIDNTQKSKYLCFRCGYKSNRLSNLKNHLNRDIECPEVYNKISAKELLELLKTKNLYKNQHDIIYPVIEHTRNRLILPNKMICNLCSKNFNSRQALKYHIGICKVNCDKGLETLES